MKVIGWRAWYADGAVFDNAKTEWDDLPADGVITIVVYFDQPAPSGAPLRRILDSSDWYFRAPDGGDWIYGHNNDDPEETKRRYPGASLKRGRWTTDCRIKEIETAAMQARNQPCASS